MPSGIHTVENTIQAAALSESAKRIDIPSSSRRRVYPRNATAKETIEKIELTNYTSIRMLITLFKLGITATKS